MTDSNTPPSGSEGSTHPTARVTDNRQEYKCYVRIYRLEIKAGRHDGGEDDLKMRVMDQSIPVVTALGYDPYSDEVILVNEFRAGPLVAGEYPYIDNLVTGSIKGDETPIDTAKREMTEETKLVLEDARLIVNNAYSSPAGITEKASIVFGIVDTSKAGGIHGLVHEKENLKSVVLSAKDFIEQAETGRIKDLRSITAAFWFSSRRDSIRRQYPSVRPASPTP